MASLEPLGASRRHVVRLTALFGGLTGRLDPSGNDFERFWKLLEGLLRLSWHRAALQPADAKFRFHPHFESSEINFGGFRACVFDGI